MLRHFVSHFPPNFEDIGQNSTPRFTSPPKGRNQNIDISCPQVRIEPTTSCVDIHTLVPLRHDWPHIFYLFRW